MNTPLIIRTRNTIHRKRGKDLCVFIPCVFLCILVFLAIYCSLCPVAEAKEYIDISSPAFKKLPIAVSEFTGSPGKEISDIIKNDLDFTGIFLCLEGNAFLENSSQPFKQENWTVIGAEAVVKGSVLGGGEKSLLASVSLYDVTEGKEIFKKEYRTEASLVRPLAHAVANDIYRHLTGEQGIFRTRIAFIGRKGGEDSLSLMDWDGHRVSDLGIKGNVLMTPRWSKDGKRLIYSSERYRQWGIYLLNFTEMTEAKVFSSKGTNIAGDFFPNADSVIFSSSIGGSPDLYMYDIATSKLTKLSSSRGIDVSPSVSPDGSQICFTSDRDGTPQIFIMDSNGYAVRRLTFQGSYNTAPSWSPKGEKIVFSGRQGGKNHIFTINPDGTGLTQLTDRGNNEDPSFSPDGRYIVFSSDRDGDRAVYIMRANGEAQKRITSKGMKAFGPRWSSN
ncbi:MAG TPA: Tol-Pal system beta propeller repeat protein TolB [Thermodesulfovibrionales bacterium]|nr:Tol-Pal system beta propeller repeat protein TolB [Thermodesulfovibrionales bacterium]